MAASNEHLVNQQRKLYFKNILRKIFLEDWLMKLVALIITFALWVGVTGLSQPAVQRMNGIPLALRYSENVDVSSAVEELNIVISGDKRKIETVNKNDLIVSLDLTNEQPGDKVIQLTPSTVSLPLPNGVKVDEITPRQITVKIEPLEIKEVSVNPVTTGQLADGYEIYDQTVNPQKIEVRGPANLVRSLSSVTTDKIDLTGRNSDVTIRQVPVNVSTTKATLLRTIVDVSFRIGEKRIERSYQVPVKGDPKRKIQVVLFGGRSLFDGIKPEDITVELQKGADGKETPHVTLPASLDDDVEMRRPKQ